MLLNSEVFLPAACPVWALKYCPQWPFRVLFLASISSPTHIHWWVLSWIPPRAQAADLWRFLSVWFSFCLIPCLPGLSTLSPQLRRTASFCLAFPFSAPCLETLSRYLAGTFIICSLLVMIIKTFFSEPGKNHRQHKGQI